MNETKQHPTAMQDLARVSRMLLLFIILLILSGITAIRLPGALNGKMPAHKEAFQKRIWGKGFVALTIPCYCLEYVHP